MRRSSRKSDGETTKGIFAISLSNLSNTIAEVDLKEIDFIGTTGRWARTTVTTAKLSLIRSEMKLYLTNLSDKREITKSSV